MFSLRPSRQALLEPFTYITSNPGKEIRGKMIEAFNEWLLVPKEKLAVISRVINMLHSASLLWVYYVGCVRVWVLITRWFFQ